MALIKCPECGREISDKAKQCPKCGWKVNVDEVKKEEVLRKKEVGIEVSRFEPNTYKSVINNEQKKIQEQARKNNENNKSEQLSQNSSKASNTDKIDVRAKLAETAGVSTDTVVEYDATRKFANVEIDVSEKNRKDNKKGKFFKKIIIAVIVLIALGAWSVILVKVAANMIVKNLNISTESIEVAESEKVIMPELTDKVTVETNQSEELGESISEIEDVSLDEIEETKEEKIEINEEDLVLENGIIINRGKTNYKGDIYNIVNAKITDETDSSYEVGFILNAEKFGSIHTTVQLQCLDEDGFEISYFYLDKPSTLGEFTGSYSIPKETKKIQICSVK